MGWRWSQRGRSCILALLSLGVLAAGHGVAAPLPIPPPLGNVSDFAGILRPGSLEHLNTQIDALRATGVKVAVVTLETALPRTPKQWATDAFAAWGVGDEADDNGLLVLLAIRDRRVEIEVGYGIEDRLTDAQAGAILDRYAVPRFKDDRWAKGLTATLDGLAEHLGASVAPEVVASYQALEARDEDLRRREARGFRRPEFPTLEFAYLWPHVPLWWLVWGELTYTYGLLLWLLGLMLVPAGFPSRELRFQGPPETGRDQAEVSPHAPEDDLSESPGTTDDAASLVLPHQLRVVWPFLTLLCLPLVLLTALATRRWHVVPLALGAFGIGLWRYFSGPADPPGKPVIRTPCCGDDHFQIWGTSVVDGIRTHKIVCSASYPDHAEVSDYAPGDGLIRAPLSHRLVSGLLLAAMAGTWSQVFRGLPAYSAPFTLAALLPAGTLLWALYRSYGTGPITYIGPSGSRSFGGLSHSSSSSYSSSSGNTTTGYSSPSPSSSTSPPSGSSGSSYAGGSSGGGGAGRSF